MKNRPRIKEIVSDSVNIGVITISGKNFGDSQDSSFVLFNFNNVKALASDYQSWSNTQIKVKVPVGVRSEKVSVTVNGIESNKVNFTVAGSNANAPGIQWQRCLGGSYPDEAKSIQQTTDGGVIVAGGTDSNDGDVSENHGEGDAWVVKLSPAGNIQWQRCLGGSDWDEAYSVQQTTDGGFIVAGHTYSNNGDVSGYHGKGDAWVVKLSPAGNVEWQRCLGGSGFELAKSVQQTTDGGFIVAGWTKSNDGDVSGKHISVNHGVEEIDAWVVKLSPTGNIQWQRCLGGSNIDEAQSVQQTTDGGFIVAGWTYSNDGDVSGNHGADAWVVKLSPAGNIQWQRCLGGSFLEFANSVEQTTDGGFIVAGYTDSNDGDVSGNHISGNGVVQKDAWVVKLSSTGNIQWQRCLGGSSVWEEAESVQQTTDGGFIVAGYTDSNDGDVSGNHGGRDAWAVKLSPAGNIQWQRCLGGSDWDEANSVEQTTDGGFIVAGYTKSNNGDVSGNHNGGDSWVVKIK